MASFDDIPDELIVAILYLIPSADIARSVQRLSHRFYHLSQEPKLWLARCRSDYVYWSAPSRALLALAGRANRGPWKQMWVERRRGDANTARHFERVLASKVNRVRHLEAICRRGLDAKDFLLAQYHVAEDAADDVLARRYHASTALASIHRGMAIEEWCKVRSEFNGFRQLDRALGAFDMFVLHDADEDMDRIELMVDQLADEFRSAHPGLEALTVREKSFALVRWVRVRNLAGMARPDINYRNVRNCLIGHALTDPEHPSLPIISSAIFASLGERIGLRAYCCAVPGHVHATVLAPAGEAVDGTLLPDGPLQQHPRPEPPLFRRRTLRERIAAGDEGGMPVGGQGSSISAAAAAPQIPASTFQLQQLHSSLPDNGERMFLDPYNDEQETTLAELRESIAEVDWGILDNRDAFMLPSPTSAIVLRVALNLEASWTHANQVSNIPELSAEAKQLRRGDPDMNLEALLYATIWATALMRPLDSASWDRHLDSLLARFAHFYSEDVWIIEKYLLPLYDRYVALSNEGAGGGFPGDRDDDDGDGDGDDDDDDDDGDESDDRQQPPRRGHHNAHHNYHNRHHHHNNNINHNPNHNHRSNNNRHNHLLQQQQRMRDWTDPRVMIKMVHNLDQRQPLVSRRYTQEICDKVLYRIGQVFRHRRFEYVGIINGWSPDDPKSLPSPNNMAMTETANPSDAEDSSNGSGRGTPIGGGSSNGGGLGGPSSSARPRKKSTFYTCLRSGVERQVVAQRNIEIITDPAAIPEPLMFLAGKHFKRFDRATCTFVSNLREFFPDD